MIPAIITTGCSSPGEREIFNRLKNDPETRDWIVLHSLDIANHVKQVSGEIDFVIIIPSKGVLCLEVKACSKLKCQDGLWYYGFNQEPDPRGPFKQASQAMHSLRNWLVKCRPGLSRVVFWSAVVFPYIEFKKTSEEWHPWQVIDSRAFRARPISNLIEAVLNNARNFLQNGHAAAWFHPESREPYPGQCEAIARVLRPNFEFIESAKTRAIRKNEELKRYTEEQFVALDAMESNPRVAFAGPAGTGKTLLAIEAAKRGCSAGRKVLFVCFNRLLGKWLEEQTSNLNPLVVTSTLHRHMLKIAGQQLKPRESQDSSFWYNELPFQAMEKLLESEGADFVYDELVVDEAQDILRNNYLDFLDLSLKGGLATGRWRFFGDFEKQDIYNNAGLSLEEFIKSRGGHAPVFSLRVNCRNTPRIAALAQMLSQSQPGYTKVLRPDNRVEPELHYYCSEEDQQQLLVQILQKMYEEGFSGGDIVILSPKASGQCAVKVNTIPWKDRIKPYETAGKGHIGYCTVHAFKGLEAGVVIVTDVYRVTGPGADNLFYIALTRALHRLVVLAAETVKSEVRNILLQRGRG
ncbi:ATP-dependent RecD-like DNA helicase [Sporotomaculum syntrophicum]|uniref:ATP-dependent RecD-like DNA helicase n=2 Tax=Sporotomaculum syntrophicum TaxID=182264 RepID=A0A9D2WMU0_9FIRM|nr:ATP-dependent RecD-like DNA helicase [Sporotomaculum syntrophicum]